MSKTMRPRLSLFGLAVAFTTLSFYPSALKPSGRAHAEKSAIESCVAENCTAVNLPDNDNKHLLFTLTPRKGFFNADHQMAYLDGAIQSYYPVNVGEPDGYVYFTYYQDGDITRQHVRLWAYTTGQHKMRAEFDIETTYEGDTNDFFFSQAQAIGGFKFLDKQTIKGAKRKTLEVKFSSDVNGGALIGMYATKKVQDGYVFILRKIQVYQDN